MMNTKTIITPRLLAASILAVSFLLSFVIIHAQAASNDSSIILKKPVGSELFTLTIKDPDGIQEFSLSPVGQSRYGGLLSGCNKSFSSDNISFHDPIHFTPVMSAYVVDCKNNTTELEILPPVKGVAASVVVKKETSPPSPPPPAPAKEEKKEGPLSIQDVQYPIPELGNCQNEAQCRSYCDNADRAKECFAFAKKYNLISAEEAKKAADRFLNVKNGPGGCNSGSSCEAHCNNIDHLDACISFAQESGYYSGEKLAEAKKIQVLVKAGKQFPGGCKDRNACEVYCSDSNHMEECLNFAEESGFMPKEEIEEARKFMTLMQKGESPGGCTSKEQCENYCFEGSHMNECIDFALKAGVMSADEAEMARKVGGKGPGGCRSKAQCDAYCQDNSDECFNFAKENGLISEDELKQMSEGMEQFRKNLDKMPPEVTACLKDSLGEENFNKITNGQPIFDRSMEDKMKSCFNQLTSQVSKQFNTLPPEATQCIKDTIGEEGLRKLQSGEFDENVDFDSLEGCFQKLQSSFGAGVGGPGGFSGPGGCKSIDECTAYCQSNPDACKDFAPPGGGSGGVFPGGPGGCKSQEECVTYCTAHYQDQACQAYTGGGQGGFPGDTGGVPGGGSGGSPGSGFSGPGGCKSQEECMAYCKEHYQDQECQAYTGSGGAGGGGFPAVSPVDFPGGGATGGGFPGGCKSQEECMAYCTTHYQDQACQAYTGGGGTNGGSQSCISPPSGLVSWWSGNGASGTVVPDVVSGNSGTVFGGVTGVVGKVSNGFKLDGSSGYINIGNPGSLNFGTGPFSLEAWFNWDGGGNSGALNIIRKSNYPVTGPGSGYWMRIGKDSKIIEFSVGATTGPEGQSLMSAPISSGIWHHAVATKDNSGVVKLYVDGTPQGTVLRQASSADSSSEAPFTLGAWDDRFGITELFPGMIDEVSVYNRALNASEVQAIFNAGSLGKCSTQSPAPSPSSQATPDYCSSFVSVPSCSYVGSPDSDNYKYCKQCFPDK